MKCYLLLAGALLAVSSGAQAQALDAQARSMAATCVGCHSGQSGQVSLAGVSRDELIQKLQAFKAGTRPATVMKQISQGYSDTQLTAVVAYFSTQKK